ncbi:MAG: LolA family protein [Myxococcaceae bacterium]
MVFESLLLVLLSQPVPSADAGTRRKPTASSLSNPVAHSSDAGVAATSAPRAMPAAGAKPGAQSKPSSMTGDVKELVDRMQAFYEKTEDFKAQFKQEYAHKTFKRKQVSTGTMTFKKPGLLRWEYEKPAPKAIVLSGDKVYLYDPEAMLLTKSRIDTNQLSASVTFLFGKGKLADEFSIEKGNCETCSGTLLVLTPLKQDPRFQQLKLEVDGKTARVLKSTVIDPDGSENAISFLDFKPNVGITKEQFTLNPAEGTQVQDLTQGMK